MINRELATSLKSLLTTLDNRNLTIIKVGNYDFRLKCKLDTGIVQMHYGVYGADDYGKLIPEDQRKYLWNIDFDGNEFSKKYEVLLIMVYDKIKSNKLIPPYSDLFSGLNITIKITSDFVPYSDENYKKVIEAKNYEVIASIKEDILVTYQSFVLPILENLNTNLGIHNYLEQNAQKYYLRSYQNGNLKRLVAKALVKAPDYMFCKSVVFDSLSEDLIKQYQPIIEFLDVKYNEGISARIEEYIISKEYYIPVTTLLQERIVKVNLELTKTVEILQFLPNAIGKSPEEKEVYPLLIYWIHASDERIKEEVIPLYQKNVQLINKQAQLLESLLNKCQANQDLLWPDIEKDFMEFERYDTLYNEGRDFRPASYNEYYALLWKERFDKAVKKYEME